MTEPHIVKNLANKCKQIQAYIGKLQKQGVIAETSPVALVRMVLADSSLLRCVQRVPSLHNAHTELLHPILVNVHYRPGKF